MYYYRRVNTHTYTHTLTHTQVPFFRESHLLRHQTFMDTTSCAYSDLELNRYQSTLPDDVISSFQTLKTSLLDSFAGRLKQGSIKSHSLTLKFISTKSGELVPTATSNCLPVITDGTFGSAQGMGDAQGAQLFDPQLYWRHLTSSVLGRVVLYTDVIPTTMTVFDG